MNSIWNSLYDRAKDRRYGVLFFVILLGFLGLFIAGMVIYKNLEGVDFGPFDLRSHLVEMVPGFLIVTAVLVWRGIQRTRMQKGNRFRREELSRDEICKARSKLMNRNKL